MLVHFHENGHLFLKAIMKVYSFLTYLVYILINMTHTQKCLFSAVLYDVIAFIFSLLGFMLFFHIIWPRYLLSCIYGFILFFRQNFNMFNNLRLCFLNIVPHTALSSLYTLSQQIQKLFKFLLKYFSRWTNSIW